MRIIEKVKVLLFIGLTVIASASLISCGEDDEKKPSFDSNGGNNGNPSTGNLTGKVNGHEYVDLGLSVNWSTCNIGSLSPTFEGLYYSWGEVSEKIAYWNENYKFYNSTTRNYSNIGNNISGTKYDVATYSWGSKWRMPTKDEFDELINKCTWTWTTISGISGYHVVGKNGQSIFLPAAGSCFNDKKKADFGIFGEYWSGTFKETTDFYSNSYALVFNQLSRKNVEGEHRYIGLTIRPVTTATADGSSGGANSGTGSGTGSSSSTSYEKPEIGLELYTCYTTSITVKYRIYNQDKAKVTSAKGYYGTSSASQSVSASVAGSLITVRITGLKKGTTYYVKCSATGKGGTTTSETTKLITDR